MHWLRSRLGAAWQATGAFGLPACSFLSQRAACCAVRRLGCSGSTSEERRSSQHLSNPHICDLPKCVARRSQVVAMRSGPQLLAAWRWLRVHAAARSGQRGRREPHIPACLPSAFCAWRCPQAKHSARRARCRRRRMVRDLVQERGCQGLILPSALLPRRHLRHGKV